MPHSTTLEPPRFGMTGPGASASLDQRLDYEAGAFSGRIDAPAYIPRGSVRGQVQAPAGVSPYTYLSTTDGREGY